MKDRNILEVREDGKLYVCWGSQPVRGFKQNVFGVAIIIVTEGM
jgi:hypothetical protein